VPIHGSIEEAGLPDVLQLLSLGRKSGCLQVEDGTTHGEIFLEVGRVTFATVANRIDRLGEILVKHGRITREQLADAAAEQSRRSSKRQLGRILVDSGRIDRSELEKYVRLQVEEAVYLLFTWKRGRFTFTTDQRPPNQPLLVSLDCESLLLEGARRVDEWSLIEKKIPSFDLVYRRTKSRVTGEVAEDLSDDQEKLLALLDGVRDVHGLVAETGMSEFDVGKALYGLIMAGFAQLVERRTQIRHLDFRELLAYVVREAEYADAERRRNAARHIVDCPSCTERLRTIHVRRTTGTLLDAMGQDVAAPAEADAAAVTIPVPAVNTAPAPPAVAPPAKRVERRAPSPVTAPVVPRPDAALVTLPPAVPPGRTAEEERREKDRRTRERRAGLDRRHGDRRAGHDRRVHERRAGHDRRQVVSATWTETHQERRSGPRRASDRRGGNGDRRHVSAGMGVVRRSGGGPQQRLTEPRLVATDLPEVKAASAPEPAAATQAPAAAGREDTFEVLPLAVETGEYLVRPAPAPAPEPKPAEPARPAPPATEPRATADLVWLQSPEEAMQQIRASRSVVRPSPPSSSPPSPPPSAAQSAPRVIPVPPPSEPRRSRPGIAGVDVPPPVRQAPRAPEAAPGVVRLEIRAATLRRAGIAAAVGGLVLISYWAGGRGGAPASPDSGTVAAAPAPQPAEPRQPAPSPATRPPAERPSAPAPTPARAQPAQTTQRAPAPVTMTTPAVAQNPPAAVARPTPAEAAATPATSAPAPASTPAAAPVTPPAVATPAPAPEPARPAPTAAEPDRELAAGGWTTVSREDAAAALGGTLGAIQGLSIESISQSTSGTRVRVRVTQLTDSGQRITLTQTRSGAAVRAGPATLTALRVMPPSEAFPYSTGTASLGNVLITARTGIPADELRAHLERLAEVR
jgi:hypothetical protein